MLVEFVLVVLVRHDRLCKGDLAKYGRIYFPYFWMNFLNKLSIVRHDCSTRFALPAQCASRSSTINC